SEEKTSSVNKLLSAASASLALVALASASPLDCPAPPPPAQIVATIGAGVSAFNFTCGGLTFNNFSAVDFGNSTGTPVMFGSATFDSATGEVVLAFNPNLINPLAFQDFHFFFQVTGGVSGVDLGVGGTSATITERVCSS